ncbi:MAG: 23S rRNA pseudouridine(955/2504/2580) synthase RluC [Pseudomonadales bacterium]|nr:23S rRNA pseudouridine(955/2504/2580) synthase RluC [Pseudomonadales bacterium]MCP5171570.1 23S rRNA pseudouridine(955/2504/2580) synthase RluC [Pseudomonadales bacterium]
MSSLDFSKVQLLEIDSDQAGQRIDNFLLARLKGVPKSRVYRILRKGEVRVNKSRVKPEYRLESGDCIRVPPVRIAEREVSPGPGQGLQKLLASSILYEDDKLLVVNKPAGLAVHGGTGINLGLIEALRAMRPDERFLELVHRLDRDTSGCLLLARKRSALRSLQSQMRNNQTRKLYQALVIGAWDRGVTRIDAPLLKTTLKSGEWMVRVDAAGKRSVTHFSVIRKYKEVSLLQATLETGRTHQIRLHAKAAGHPLVGDEKYGDEAFNLSMQNKGLKRMFLHAVELSFEHPDGYRLTVKAPLPNELSGFLAILDGD